jgi:hypothetical protein
MPSEQPRDYTGPLISSRKTPGVDTNMQLAPHVRFDHKKKRNVIAGFEVAELQDRRRKAPVAMQMFAALGVLAFVAIVATVGGYAYAALGNG